MSSRLNNCPACGASDLNYRWTARDTLGVSWRYDECAGCGAIFVNPPVEPGEWDKYYNEEYYGPEHRRFKGLFEKTVSLFRRIKAKQLGRMIPKNGALLDVGCGRGIILNILSEQGYKCVGTERSELSARDARLKSEVRVGELDELNFPSESFDLVTLWQVIEHLDDPKMIFAETGRILKKGGRMLIQTPNPDSWQARAGQYWFHLDPPRHIILFPIRSLDALAKSAGLEKERISHFNLEFGPFGVLQSLWNIFGMKRDLFYETLSAGTKPESSPSFPVKAAMFAISLIVAPFATVISFMESAARKGGVIEVVYRKK